MRDAWTGREGNLRLQALGLAIRKRREGLGGISQEELALRADLHRTYLSGIERGHRNPTYRNLVKIAAALDVRLSELVSSAEAWERSLGSRM
jgi:transcriptional regulator with XRE-family HTH domain